MAGKPELTFNSVAIRAPNAEVNIRDSATIKQVLETGKLFDGDVWNVIWAIEKEFGIGALPGEFTTDDCFIDCLINLRFEQLGDMA